MDAKSEFIISEDVLNLNMIIKFINIRIYINKILKINDKLVTIIRKKFY